VWSILIIINSENSRLSLVVHTIHYLKTSKLNPGFEFHQLLVSLKHVINLDIWIRYTGCHTSTCSRHDLLELLLVVVFKAVLLFVVTLVAIVVPVGVVIHVGGVKLLPLGVIGDEVSGVTALEVAPG
jgi:hypothetical protein